MAAAAEDVGNVVDLFMNPATKRWLAEFSHTLFDSSPIQSENEFITGCGWFQWFYAAILVARRKGYRIPPRTRQDSTLLYEALRQERMNILQNRTHELHDYFVNQRIDPQVCVPYDPSRAPDASHEALCFVRQGHMGNYIAHYFSRIHTPDRGDWILSAYGSCYIQIPGTLIPLDPAAWDAFVAAIQEPSESQHPVIRSFFLTYLLQGSLETYHDDETTTNESLYGQPIVNREERELRYVYDPNPMESQTFALYHVPEYESYLKIPSIDELQRSRRGGSRRHKKQVTRRKLRSRKLHSRKLRR